MALPARLPLPSADTVSSAPAVEEVEQAELPTAAGSEMSEELGAEPVMPQWRIDELARKYDDKLEDYGDWKDDYADNVGISRYREL